MLPAPRDATYVLVRGCAHTSDRDDHPRYVGVCCVVAEGSKRPRRQVPTITPPAVAPTVDIHRAAGNRHLSVFVLAWSEVGHADRFARIMT